ncbi:MAG: hypothetical protein WBO29_11985 [Albidovulum sp.]
MRKSILTFATAALLSAAALTANAQTVSVVEDTNATVAQLDMVAARVDSTLAEYNIPDRQAVDLTLDQARRIIAQTGSAEAGDAPRLAILRILDE